MPYWWEKWPGRLEEEIESFARHDIEVTRDEKAFHAGRLILRGVIATRRGDVEFEVRYPSLYPVVRFAVIAPALSLDRHQHPFGKSLCIFPRGSEHWRRDWLAGDVVAERIPHLIDTVTRGGDHMRKAEDPQGEPFTDYFSYTPLGGIVVESEVMAKAERSSSGKMVVQLMGTADWITAAPQEPESAGSVALGTGLVVSVSDDAAETVQVPEQMQDAYRGDQLSGRWIRLEAPPGTDDWANTYQTLLANSPHFRNSPDNRVDGWLIRLIGLVFPEEVRQGEYGDAWVFLAVIRKPQRKERRRGRTAASPTNEQVGIVPIRALRGGVDHLGERIPELASLRSRSVSVFGLGTLGSPFAKEMARSMIRELHLVDYDFVDPATSVRFETGYEFGGISKPFALAETFRRNYPYTTTVPHHFSIGGDSTHDGDPDDIRLNDIVDRTDLVVDATAEDNVTAALADAAWDAGRSFIALWSIEGVGGVVLRLLPGETGCFYCMELHLSADRGTIQLPPPPADPKRVQPKGCADPTFTSPAADLQPLVSMASRLAFGELTVNGEAGYPRHQGDAYVLWLRHPDGSLYDPSRWESHLLPIHPDCPFHGD